MAIYVILIFKKELKLLLLKLAASSHPTDQVYNIKLCFQETSSGHVSTVDAPESVSLYLGVWFINIPQICVLKLFLHSFK